MHLCRTPQIVEDLYCEVCEESLNYLTVCIWNRNKNLQVIINLGENMLMKGNLKLAHLYTIEPHSFRQTF
jgi:hypothetical protein